VRDRGGRGDAGVRGTARRDAPGRRAADPRRLGVARSRPRLGAHERGDRGRHRAVAVRAAARAARRGAGVAEGEVVTELRLAGGTSGPTASVVPDGLRAVSIPVPASVGVRPGDLVDVLATFGGGGAHTEVTGEALEVLRVDRGAGASFGGAGAPTSSGVGLVLLVSPDQAERLAFAATFATLSIAVIGPDELLPDATAPTGPTTFGG
jgi:Flp pilus assembly protein CpaB